MRLGKYELLCELASGGMGTVHVARQLGAAGFSRLVVVKRLHSHLAKLPEFRNMVRDEANLASQIRHPNVVPVVDVVEHEDELCLVLEYVPSVSLSTLSRAAKARGRALEPAVASRIVLDVLAGLHAAHEVRDMAGEALAIVHRDVSPQNVVVGADGCARLIDFGIAKAAVRFARTKTGDLKGKLSYMAPEQLQRKEVDRRADVFAAGVVLYETLAGAPLFSGDDEGAIVLSILMGPSNDLVKRGFSRGVEEVLDKALTTSPDERFPTARAFQEALEAVIPPASSNEVADVVRALCGDSFEERRQRLRALVEGAGGKGEAAARSEPVTQVEVLEASERPSLPPAARPPRRRALVAALVALVVLGAATAVLVRRSWSATREPAEGPAGATSAIHAASVPAASSEPPLGPVTPAPTASAGSTASTGASAPASAIPASPTPASAITSKPARSPHGAPAPLRRNPYR